MTSPVFTPLQMFYSTSGLPLTDGYIYIGTASQNPQTNPIAVYWDAAGTIPAAQPIRTSGGYPVRNGSPATVFVLATDFSLIVRDKSSKLVFSRLSGNAFSAEWVTYTPAGTGAVATSVQTKLRESVSVKDFGAVGDGVTDDTAEIQTAITSLSATGGVLFFPTGTYLVSAALNLVSNLTMEFAGGAKLKLNAGNTTEYVLRGATKDNLVFRDVVIEGSGLAGFSAVYLSSCNNVLFDNCKVTKAGSIGLSFISCTKVKVINCELSNNYYYGLEFRDCESCKAIGNDCYQNGSTGLATSTGGRGIMLWRSRYCYVAGNRMAANTEYGFRIYSEAADATTSNFNVITGNVFADNTVCDFVIYDEGAASSFTAYNLISDNTVYRTTNATIGAVFTIQGDYNTFVNNHVYKSGAFGSGAAFNFFNANYCTISNSSANNIAVAFSTSSSANITIENCLGYNIANALTVPTANITIKNCKFIHGGGGGSDVAIINYATATGKNYYEGNIFQDFHTGIYIASEAVALFRNTSINSGFAGLRLTGNDFSLMECGGNSWDITQPYLLSAMTKTVSTYDQATTVFNIAPTTLTWGVGARVYNSAPAVGQPKSWVCTVAGTPGTWVSEGNL